MIKHHRPAAAGIGELLWDILPDGKKLGGAPANFAYHFQAIGGESAVISTVGKDKLGEEALDLLQHHGLKTGSISLDTSHETGRVIASLDEQGVASYEFPDEVAWDYLRTNESALNNISQADALCFGTLAQRSPVSRSAIHALIDAAPPHALKVFDINLRQDFYSREVIQTSLQICDILKINDEELDIVASMLGLPMDWSQAMPALLSAYDLKVVALTCGDKGSRLMTPEEMSSIEGTKEEVKDTVGAGDSFTAAMTLGMLTEMPLKELHAYAAEVAAYVCTCSGAMPAMPEKFKK